MGVHGWIGGVIQRGVIQRGSVHPFSVVWGVEVRGGWLIEGRDRVEWVEWVEYGESGVGSGDSEMAVGVE